ncbi:MAG: hypothetical protein LBC75_06170 [Fibromonadaceae bacterium]|nr:hypothetical protein [Fibromonadaceae bacterium]
MLKLYSLLLLAAALFLSCVAIGFVDENNIDTCGGEKYTSESQICENDTLKKPCGNGYYDPKMQFCAEQDNKVYDKCEGRGYNPLNQICENNIVLDECGNDYYNPSSEYCFNNVIREYTYVTIGNQTWMSENLRREAPNIECYNDEPDNCIIFGILYDWSTAKNICPAGWHLPYSYEWDILRDFVEDNSKCNDCAGTKLKANSELWISGKGTDDFGFNALPGGFYHDAAIYHGGTPFIKKGERAAFWSGGSNMQTIEYNQATLNFSPSYSYGYAMAYVRCIKD